MSQNFKSFARYLSLLTFIFLSFPVFTKAVVTVDNSASFGEFNLVPPVPHTIMWQHTIGTGISRALIVTVSRHNTTVPLGTGFQTQNVTFTDSLNNTTSLTSFSQFFPTNTPDGKSSVQVFYLLNPTSGTGTVNVTLDPLSEYAFGSSVSFLGVNPTNSFGSYSTNSNSGPTSSITLSDPVTGDLVIDVLAAPFNSGPFAVGVGQTVCYPDDTVETNCLRGRRFWGNISDVGASSTKPANSLVNMSWTLTNYVGGDWIMGAVAVKALPTTAALGTVSGRVLNFNGRGIPRVSISITRGNGENLTTRTSLFGYYHFEGLELGNTYILQPRSKIFSFAPRILNLDNSIANLNLYPTGK